MQNGSKIINHSAGIASPFPQIFDLFLAWCIDCSQEHYSKYYRISLFICCGNEYISAAKERWSFYRSHPKDGEGTVFIGVCLSTPGGTPSPSHGTSTGPMFFLGGTSSPSHNTSICPMSFPGGTPVTGPRSLPGGTQDGVPPARSGWGGTSYPGWWGHLNYTYYDQSCTLTPCPCTPTPCALSPLHPTSHLVKFSRHIFRKYGANCS